ncbi:unnamed protein product [Angiostrongylus costaricensis]|uniref:PH domain-containing protein n=1 Tax=Angiostrongylus costaricensis TaxID=334426 RepID=A0A0R3PZC4_ANGCS|nr:unnamed protein product [Angiostrongylus costaricensis]
MSSSYPIPKPRTRFNVSFCCGFFTGLLTRLHFPFKNGSLNEVNTSISEEKLQNNTVERFDLLPPPLPPLLPPRPPPTTPEIKLPTESTSDPPRLPHSGRENHEIPALVPTVSPPLPCCPKGWEKTSPTYIDSNSYETVRRCHSTMPDPTCRRIDFIENPIYMSLVSFRKKAFGDVEKKTEMNGERSQTPLDTEICGPSRGDNERNIFLLSTNDMEENEDMQHSSSDFSCFSDSSHGVLEKTIPPTKSVLSSRPENFEDRNRNSMNNKCGMDSSLLDNLEKVVEIAEDPKNIDEIDNLHDENSPSTQFSSTAVAYFGNVSLHIGKRDRRKSEECIAGPFSLLECELICRDEQNITIRLSEKETGKSVIFTSDSDAETWTLLLGEVGIH